jgi:acetoacetyl-CoA synthetase
MEESNDDTIPQLMWSPGLFGKTKIDCFRELINEKFNLNLLSYWDLYKWSIDNYSEFWEQFWSFAKIINFSSYESVVDKSKQIDEIPEWFTGAKLNYTQNILENRLHDKVALYIAGESKPEVEKVTFGQMEARIRSLVSAMRKIGITNGDRVVGKV